MSDAGQARINEDARQRGRKTSVRFRPELITSVDVFDEDGMFRTIKEASFTCFNTCEPL